MIGLRLAPSHCRKLGPLHRLTIGRHHSTSRVFKEGDLVLLRDLRNLDDIRLLSKPLHPAGSFNNSRGTVKFSDILGKQPPAFVTSSRGQRYCALKPTLAQYVTETRRIATPIYPADANLIVSLLDLHPTAPPPDGQEDTDPKIQVLEAGTGHGALTLHLARAVHAANPRCPSDDSGESMRLWKEKRRAVIHSIDINEKHSLRGRKNVERFKEGIYYPTVDFHVSPIRDWIAGRHETEPFLTAAILDLPGSQHELAAVSKYMQIAGLVLLFMPSITQLVDAQRAVVEQNLPLYLERVIEVGGGMSGGREWSVQFVRTRESLRKTGTQSGDGEPSSKPTAKQNSDLPEPDAWETETEPQQKHVSVCRPKPGVRVVGGGFIGLWRRVEARDGIFTSDSETKKGLREAAGQVPGTKEINPNVSHS